MDSLINFQPVSGAQSTTYLQELHDKLYLRRKYINSSRNLMKKELKKASEKTILQPKLPIYTFT
jgi:hypothetical protein